MTFVMRDVVIITLIVVKLSSNGVDKNIQLYATRYCKTYIAVVVSSLSYKIFTVEFISKFYSNQDAIRLSVTLLIKMICTDYMDVTEWT